MKRWRGPIHCDPENAPVFISCVARFQASVSAAYVTEHSPGPSVGLSVCLSAKYIVAKRLSGSGCHWGGE